LSRAIHSRVSLEKSASPQAFRLRRKWPCFRSISLDRAAHSLASLEKSTIHLAEEFGEWLGATLRVDAGDDRVSADEDFVAAADGVGVVDTSAFGFGGFGFHPQNVVKYGSSEELAAQLGHDQEDAGGLQIGVGDAGGPQHFHSDAFEVVRIGGVVDAALGIRLLVADTDFNLELS
jgi:hypothetical protein